MSIFKKALALLLVIALTAAIAVNVTLAYLVDEKSDVNVMTLGNVKIVQHEYERKVEASGKYSTATIDGKTSYVLKDFEQGKPLMPAIIPNGGTVNGVKWDYDSTPVRMSQVKSHGGASVFNTPNAVDKFVTVENTGKSAAYVRTFVAFEVGTAVIEDDRYPNQDLINSEMRAEVADKNTEGKQPWTYGYSGFVTIDNNKYLVYELIYTGAKTSSGWKHANGVLPAGETTYPSLCQVYLASRATNEDVEALDGNKNGTYDILVLSQAVQTAGFDSATTALDTAFGKADEETVAAWFEGIGNVQYVEVSGTKVTVEGEAAEEYLEDLKNGQNLMVDKDVDIIAFDTNAVDAQGATVTLAGVGPDAYGYLAFVPDALEDVTVSNLNVTGSGFVEIGHYGQGGGNYTANNLKIENLASTLKNENKGIYVGCAFMAFGDTVLNDCVMTGTTAIQDGTRAVDLGCGQAWKGYTDDDNKVSTTVNRGEYGTIYCWSHALVTINGAKVDTIYVAPIAGLVTLNAGTEVDTIMVDYGNLSLSTYATKANLQKLVIDPDASVNQIIFDGNTYTVSEWNTYLASLT